MTLVANCAGIVPSQRLSCHVCETESEISSSPYVSWLLHLRPGNLSPHNPDLGATDFALSSVDVCYFLAQVESGKL